VEVQRGEGREKENELNLMNASLQINGARHELNKPNKGEGESRGNTSISVASLSLRYLSSELSLSLVGILFSLARQTVSDIHCSPVSFMCRRRLVTMFSRDDRNTQAGE